MATKSEEWEQFAAYRPMIQDARRRERALIIEELKTASAYDRLKRNGELTETLDATILVIELGAKALIEKEERRK